MECILRVASHPERILRPALSLLSDHPRRTLSRSLKKSFQFSVAGLGPGG